MGTIGSYDFGERWQEGSLNTPSKASFKKRRWRLVLVSVPIFLLLGVIQLLQTNNDQSSFKAPSDLKSFVKITSSATFQLSCDGKWSGSGWGLEFDGKPYVVTAQHVIKKCLENGQIHARNEVFELDLLSYDGRYWLGDFLNYRDLALLKAQVDIPVLHFALAKPDVGQWVAVLGYPADSELSTRFSMTTGTITGLVREGFLVTDAALNEGNSGGPMVNSLGEVLGTVFASEPPDEFENMGFAQSMELHCDVILTCVDGKLTTEITKKYLNYGYTTK